MTPHPENPSTSPAAGRNHPSTPPAPGVGPRYDELAGHMARAHRMRADAAADLAGGIVAMLRRLRHGMAAGSPGRDRDAICTSVRSPAGSRA